MQRLRPHLNASFLLLLTLLASNTAGQAPDVEEISDYANVLTRTSQHSPIRATSWPADGAMVLTLTRDAVTGWSWQSGQELWRTTGMKGESDHFAISPSGTAAAIDSGAALYVYSLPAGESRTIQLDEGRVSDLIFADDQAVLIGTTLGHLCLWRWTAEDSLHCSKPHQEPVSSMVFDPVGRRIFSAAWNEIVETKFDPTRSNLGRDPEVARFYGSWGFLSTLTTSVDGSTLAFGSAEGKIWTAATGAISSTELVTSTLNHVSALDFSPDGSVLVSGDRDGRLDLWNVHSGKHLLQLEGHPLPIEDLAFDPASKLIASGSSDGSTKIWSFSSGELAQTLEGHARQITQTALSSNGRWLAVLSLAGELFIWDLEQGIETSRLTPVDLVDARSGRIPSSLAIDSAGAAVAIGLKNGDIQLVRPSAGALPRAFASLRVAIDALAFDASGATLASGAHDGSISLWDVTTGVKEPPEAVLGRPIRDLAFATDDRLDVLTVGGQLVRWDTSSRDDPDPITLEGKPSSLTNHSTHGLLVAYDDGSFRLGLSGSTDVEAENTTLVGRLRAASYGGNRRAWVDDNRIIQVETLPDESSSYSRTWSLLSGARHLWAACDSAGRCRRQDDGSLLVTLQDSVVRPLSPPSRQALISVEVHPSAKSLNVSDGTSETVSVEVKNRGAEAIHWLRLLEAEDDSGRPIVFKPSETFPSLPPGGDVTLDGRISVQSDYESPKPQNLVLQLELLAGTGARIQTSPIEIKTQVPSLAWRGSHWHSDASRLEIRLQNIGKARLAESMATLQISGAALEPRPLPALPSNEETMVSFVLPKEIDPESEAFDLVVETTVHPLHRWVFRSQRARSWLQRFLVPIALASLVLVGFLLWHYRFRYTGHSLTRLVQQPRELLELPADQLVEADRILQKIDRLDPVLRQIDVRRASFDLAVEFLTTTDPALRAQQLADHLGSRLVKPMAKNDRLWRLMLGENFPLNLSECVLRLPGPEATSTGIVSDLAAQVETKNRITLVLLHNMEQQDALSLQTGPENPWIAPTSRELTQLLLARNPLEILAGITARHVAATKISPYQVRQGIQKESMFFGREEILNQILQGNPANYLVVGARKVGKSSLLHALKRRLADDPETVGHFVVLSDDDLIGRLALLFGIDKRHPRANDLLQYLDNTNKSHLILIDEVDPFIRQDGAKDFVGLQLLRSLSEEGKCHFVLAGFWDLFAHTQRDYLSPLKNFGEVIRLGELEKDACIRLATVPMARLGLQYEDPALVERLIMETGQRPNLISVACHELVKSAGIEGRRIFGEDLEKSLHSPAMYDALEIGALGGASAKLEQIITYATVESGEFTIADLIERLRPLRVKSDQEAIEEALGRLELASVLKSIGGARFEYQVPLYRSMLMKREPERLLIDALSDKES